MKLRNPIKPRKPRVPNSSTPTLKSEARTVERAVDLDAGRQLARGKVELLGARAQQPHGLRT